MNQVNMFKKKYHLSTPQLAKYLGMSRVGVWKWTKQKKNDDKVEMLLKGLETKLIEVNHTVWKKGK